MNSLDYRLLRYLLANGTSDLDELAESENVSTRTMQKYIHELGESLGDAAEIRINKMVTSCTSWIIANFL